MFRKIMCRWATLVVALCLSPAVAQTTRPVQALPAGARNTRFVVLTWNDLGMHCISPRFAEMAILPPYNNIMAQVIRRAEEPGIVTQGVTVAYAFPGNTTVVGKSDFWTYAQALFGKDLAPGVGLTGNGLSGRMAASGTRFVASGVPILPLNDAMVWNPYQVASIRVRYLDQVVARASVVVPVSEEMKCGKCHGGERPRLTTIDTNILTLHDQREGTTLMASKLAADNALPLSLQGNNHAIGYKACYVCHTDGRRGDVPPHEDDDD